MINIPGRVREALKSGMYKKNYRVLVYDASGELIKTLNNDNLIKESVKLDERMCSGETITFGLCEGSSLEFQYFNYDNINGKRIKLMLDVEYLAEDGTKQWYEMPMGYFDVAQCPMQFSTGVYKVTAYNKLKSKYIDADMSKEIISIVEQGEEGGTTGEATVDAILYGLLQGYAIDEYYSCDLAKAMPPLPIKDDRSTWRAEYKNCQKLISSTTYTKTYRITLWLECAVDYSPTTIQDGDYIRFYDNPTYLKSVFYKYVSDNAYADTSTKLRDYLYNYTNVVGTNGLPSMDKICDGINEGIGKYVVVHPTARAKMTFNYIPWSTSYNVMLPNTQAYHMPTEPVVWDTYYDDIVEAMQYVESNLFGGKYFRVDERLEKQGSKIEITSEDLTNISNGITLRELQSALFEMNCQFGRLDRDTDLFAGLDLNNNRLLPADNLYPSNTLVPLSNSERTDASAYEKLWTDSSGVQSFRKLYITYRGLDEEGRNVEYVLERTVNANGTQDYNMSDNWLFKNLTWTAEQVGQYADVIVAKMRNISWFPFEAWCAGLPYLEPGDELEISNSEGTYTSYILQRQLSGIQMLKDTYINGELDIF